MTAAGDRVRVYKRNELGCSFNGKPATVIRSAELGGQGPRWTIRIDGELSTRVLHEDQLQPLDQAPTSPEAA